MPEAYVDFVHWLLDRCKTRLKFDDFISELMASIGQGDPFSMVLYILFNADLLEWLALLDNEDSIGYVNDTMVITFGEDFHKTTAMLVHMMTRIDGGLAWSLAHNSCFKISKLAMLHASQCTQQDPENPRKRIPLDRLPL